MTRLPNACSCFEIQQRRFADLAKVTLDRVETLGPPGFRRTIVRSGLFGLGVAPRLRIFVLIPARHARAASRDG
jgi:hypothetical protein